MFARLIKICILLGTIGCGMTLRAQDPEILPEMPGLNLPAGEEYAEPNLLPSDVIDPGMIAVEAAASATPSPPPPAPFGVTGDWMGVRTSLQENGINLRTNFTQFYQGVTSGGLEQQFAYGPKFDYFGIVEMEKLLGVKGMYINLHGESRFGQSVNRLDGSILPANFALQFPSGQGQASALTNMQIQQFLSENFVVSFGKLNTADGTNIHPFMGGYGTDRFMNTAFILNPAFGRGIPYSTLGASFTYLRNFDPVATLLIVDPMGRPGEAGFDPMLSNGVSLLGQIRLPVRPAELPGHQTIEIVWSSGKFSPLSSDDYVIIPGQGLLARRQTGTWAVNYGFDQFIVHDDETPGKGWGIFGNFTVADQQTNPLAGYISVGVAGSRLIAARPDDSFGLAYFYLDVSDSLQRSLQRFLPIGDEQGFEAYYNMALTRWFQLTFDIQAMDTARSDAESAFLFGMRGKIIF